MQLSATLSDVTSFLSTHGIPGTARIPVAIHGTSAMTTLAHVTCHVPILDEGKRRR